MTLIEFLTVMTMAIVVFAGAVGFYQVVVNRTEDTTARADTLSSSRVAMEQITRDIREGTTATVGSGGASLTIVTPLEQIIYSCSAGSCTRSTKTLAGVTTGNPRVTISGLNASTVVFQSATITGAAHASIRVTLNATPDGRETPIALTEDVTLRNECVTYSLVSACT